MTYEEWLRKRKQNQTAGNTGGSSDSAEVAAKPKSTGEGMSYEEWMNARAGNGSAELWKQSGIEAMDRDFQAFAKDERRWLEQGAFSKQYSSNAELWRGNIAQERAWLEKYGARMGENAQRISDALDGYEETLNYYDSLYAATAEYEQAGQKVSDYLTAGVDPAQIDMAGLLQGKANVSSGATVVLATDQHSKAQEQLMQSFQPFASGTAMDKDNQATLGKEVSGQRARTQMALTWLDQHQGELGEEVYNGLKGYYEKAMTQLDLMDSTVQWYADGKSAAVYQDMGNMIQAFQKGEAPTAELAQQEESLYVEVQELQEAVDTWQQQYDDMREAINEGRISEKNLQAAQENLTFSRDNLRGYQQMLQQKEQELQEVQEREAFYWALATAQRREDPDAEAAIQEGEAIREQAVAKKEADIVRYYNSGTTSEFLEPQMWAMKMNPLALDIEHLKEEEKKNFYYLIGKGYDSLAVQYVNDMALDRRRTKMAEAEEWAGTNAGTQILAFLQQGILFPVAGYDLAAGYIKSAVSGLDVDPNLGPAAIKDALNSGVAKAWDEWSGTLPDNLPVLGGKGLGTVYQMGVSTGESYGSAAAMGPYATIFMGLSAASSAYNEAVMNGASPEQALVQGAAQGVAEALYEKISIGRWLDGKDYGSIVKNALVQGGVEASEEMLTSITNAITDRLIMQDKSAFNRSIQSYIDQGYSKEDAENKAWRELLEEIAFDSVTGFITGGTMGGASSAVNYISTGKTAQQILAGANSSSLEELQGYYVAQLAAGVQEADTAQEQKKKIAAWLRQGGEYTSEQLQQARSMAEDKINGREVVYPQAQEEAEPEYTGQRYEMAAEEIIDNARAMATEGFTGLGMSQREAEQIANNLERAIRTGEITDKRIDQMKPTDIRYLAVIEDALNVEIPRGNGIVQARANVRAAIEEARARYLGEATAPVIEIGQEQAEQLRAMSDEELQLQLELERELRDDTSAQPIVRQQAQQALDVLEQEYRRRNGGAKNVQQQEQAAPAPAAKQGEQAERGTTVRNAEPQRNDRVGTGEQGGAVQERNAAQVERGRQGANDQGDRGKGVRKKRDLSRYANIAKTKSTRDYLGKAGAEEVTLGEVTEEYWTNEMRQAAEKAEAAGLTVHYVVGSILRANGDRGGGGVYYRGTILASVNDVRFLPEQLVEHEIYHAEATEEATEEILAAIRERYTAEEFERIVREYADEYNGIIAEGDTQALYEEIAADAAGGMNRFAETAKVEESREQAQEIISRTGREAQRGDRTRAPPAEPKYSYAGEEAKTADLKSLKAAQEMLKLNASMEDIRKATGWHQGKDGKWRFEIDDSGMKYFRGGDAQFQRDHPEYAEYQNLLQKMLFGTITSEEYSRIQEIDSTWGDEYGRLRDRLRSGSGKLVNVIQHDALFAAYPELENVGFQFQELPAGVNGYFDKAQNRIVLSEKLANAPESAILHEIQHVIQIYEGFAPGASVEYWEAKAQEQGLTAEELYRNTVGEIEARDAAARRKLTAEERKKTSPDYGDENAVFAPSAANGFSIEILPDGEKIAVINTDQSLFSNKPLKEFPKIARKAIMDKFKNTVLALGENDLAKVGKRSWEEYAYPSIRLNPSSKEFEAKMRAATELNNLLETAEFSHWEENKKPSKKDVYSYDYYKVRFVLAGHLFEGLINIENNKNTRLFYDITKIKEIPDTSGKYAALMAQSTSAFGNLYNDRIQQNDQKVKQDFLFDSEEENIRWSVASEADIEKTADSEAVEDEDAKRPWEIVSDEQHAAARGMGYPVLDGEQVIPFKTWVQATDIDPDTGEPRNNYGLVVSNSVTTRQLGVNFWNKNAANGNRTEGNAEFRYVQYQDLHPVQGQYQMTDAEYASLMESAPEEVAREQIDFMGDNAAEFSKLYEEILWQREQQRLRDEENGLKLDEAPEGFPWSYKKPLRSTETRLSPRDAARYLEAATGKEWLITRTKGGSRWKAVPGKRNAEHVKDEAYEAEKAEAESRGETFKSLKEYAWEKLQEAMLQPGEQVSYVHPEGIDRAAFKGTEAINKLGIRISGSVVDYADTETIKEREMALRKSSLNIQKMERALTKNEGKAGLGSETIKYAKLIAEGDLLMEDIPKRLNRRDVIKLAEMMLDHKMIGEDLSNKRKLAINRELQAEALNRLPDQEGVDAGTEQLKRLKLAVMNYRTPERNLRAMFGEERGADLFDYYFRTARENEAERKRWMQEQFDGAREFVGQNGKAKGLNKQESAYVHAMLDMEGYSHLIERSKNAAQIKELSKAWEEAKKKDPKADLSARAAAMEQLRNGAEKQTVKLDATEKALAETLTYTEVEWAQKWAEWRAMQADRKTTAKIDKIRCDNAVMHFRAAFDAYYKAMVDFMVAHGLTPLGHIDYYAPHLTINDRSEIMAGFFNVLGLKSEKFGNISELPADIAGKTQDFRPTRKWNPFALKRTGTKTDYNIVEAFEKYVTHVAEVFYHHDDLLKLRALEAATRNTANRDWQKEMRKLIMAARSGDLEEKQQVLRKLGVKIPEDMDPVEMFRQLSREADVEKKHNWLIKLGEVTKEEILTEEQVHVLFDELGRKSERAFITKADQLFKEYGLGAESNSATLAEAEDKLNRIFEHLLQSDNAATQYTNFVQWLNNYNNLLAGKQYGGDRGMEYSGGRKLLDLANNVSRRFSGAKVIGNMGSVIAQAAQMPAIIKSRSAAAQAKAFRDIMASVSSKFERGRELREWKIYSDILTGKRGVEYIREGFWEKVIGYATKPMEWVDSFVTTFAARSAYYDAIDGKVDGIAKGNQKAANRYADDFATQIMGVRDKGSRPNAFSSKLGAMVNVFQVEALNLMDHFASDMPAQWRADARKYGKAKASAKLAWSMFVYFAAAFMLNRGGDELYGQTPAAFSIADYILQFIAAGYGVTTNELIFGGGDKKEEFQWDDAWAELGYEVMGDIPLVSNIAAMAGYGDQKMPLPDVNKIWDGVSKAFLAMTGQGVSGKEAMKAIGKALAEVMPLGNQINKTIQGIIALADSGVYNDDGALQWAVDHDAWSILQNVIFGANATQEAQAYYAGGYGALNAQLTEAYEEFVEDGMEPNDAYDLVYELRKIDRRNADLPAAEVNALQREWINQADISDEDKLYLFTQTFGSKDPDTGMIEHKDAEAFDLLMDAGMSWAEIQVMYEKHEELENVEEMESHQKNLDFNYWVRQQNYNAEQEELILKNFGQVERFVKLADSGIGDDAAKELEEQIQAYSDSLPEGESLKSADKIRIIMDYGLSDSDCYKALRTVLGDGTFDKLSYARDNGISCQDYMSFYLATKDMESDRDEEGKIIKGQATKDKVLAYINSLPISSQEKDILFLTEYKESGLPEAPWN